MDGSALVSGIGFSLLLLTSCTSYGGLRSVRSIHNVEHLQQIPHLLRG